VKLATEENDETIKQIANSNMGTALRDHGKFKCLGEGACSCGLPVPFTTRTVAFSFSLAFAHCFGVYRRILVVR
jgi:hypothetical protein